MSPARKEPLSVNLFMIVLGTFVVAFILRKAFNLPIIPAFVVCLGLLVVLGLMRMRVR